MQLSEAVVDKSAVDNSTDDNSGRERKIPSEVDAVLTIEAGQLVLWYRQQDGEEARRRIRRDRQLHVTLAAISRASGRPVVLGMTNRIDSPEAWARDPAVIQLARAINRRYTSGPGAENLTRAPDKAAAP